MHRLLIANSSEQLVLALSEMLEDSFEISSCCAGDAVMDHVRLFQPDVVVLDTMLPGVDGISVLETMQLAGIRPRVLLTARHISDYVINAAARCHVDFVMSVPCNLRALGARVKDLASMDDHTHESYSGSSDLLDRIYFDLGMKTGSDAYKELVEATRILLQDPGAALTKIVYPEVGKRFKKERNQVERAIARCIEYAWKQRDDRIWLKYFPQSCLSQTTKPTNGYFLSRIVSYILQQE